jgi:hypothetical protein
MLDFQKNLALLLAITAIFSGLLSPVLGLDFAGGHLEEMEVMEATMNCNLILILV